MISTILIFCKRKGGKKGTKERRKKVPLTKWELYGGKTRKEKRILLV